jgi:hypothetical protein
MFGPTDLTQPAIYSWVQSLWLFAQKLSVRKDGGLKAAMALNLPSIWSTAFDMGQCTRCLRRDLA